MDQERRGLVAGIPLAARMSYDIAAACAAANQRIAEHINRAAGQHKRAIRKAFEQAGAPVVGHVSTPPQRRIPMVSEGTESAQRINKGQS